MHPEPINPDSKSMDEAVKDNSFWSASEADMQRWLRSVCVEPTGNSHTAKEVVKGITLNHLQMVLLINKIDRSNFWTQIGFALIALTALVLSAFQIVDSHRQQEVTITKSLVTLPVSVVGGNAKADQGTTGADNPKPLNDKTPLVIPPTPNSPAKK